MKRIARLAGLFSILMLLFVVALVASQRLLTRQTERLRDEAIARKQAQLAAAIEMAGIGPPPWPAEVTERLARALDAEIETPPRPPLNTQGRPTTWRFIHTFADDPTAPSVLVRFDPPSAARLLATYHRVAAILLNLALGMIAVFSAFLLWSIRNRDGVDDSNTTQGDHARAGLQSLHHLASVSARQSDELERERAGRLRIEEDLHIKQLLLNRALEQKIRLGQDLHDGIIQSLYATGLTLEATRALIATDPTAAEARIAEATRTLNATIREVRAYIAGLSPETLRRQTFTEAVQVLTHDLAAGRPAEFVISIDEPTAAGLRDDAATDLLQVIREAVSNSLRHGQARHVAIRLEPTAQGPRLTISDDGSGFARDQRSPAGHGLANIEARIRRHGGTCRIESRHGHGASVIAVLPHSQATADPTP